MKLPIKRSNKYFNATKTDEVILQPILSRLTNGMPFAQQFVHVSKGTDAQMPRKTKYIQHPTHPSQCVSFM